MENKDIQLTMKQTRFKKIPFDIELAKKITNGEVNGRIVTRDGCQVRIICFDRKEKKWQIVALVQMSENYESVIIYKSNGAYSNFEEKVFDLLIEVPTYYRDYSNFVPQKWQPCLVRENEDDYWKVRVCAENKQKARFYESGNFSSYGNILWNIKLPLSNETERLIGTTKSYEELVKELDE